MGEEGRTKGKGQAGKRGARAALPSLFTTSSAASSTDEVLWGQTLAFNEVRLGVVWEEGCNNMKSSEALQYLLVL